MGTKNPGAVPEDIQTQILHADHNQIAQIANALIQRFSTLYPNDELFLLSLPKNAPEDAEKYWSPPSHS